MSDTDAHIGDHQLTLLPDGGEIDGRITDIDAAEVGALASAAFRYDVTVTVTDGDQSRLAEGDRVDLVLTVGEPVHDNWQVTDIGEACVALTTDAKAPMNPLATLCAGWCNDD